jgi:hypothetical protein
MAGCAYDSRMSIFQDQLKKEARWDVRVSLVLLIVFFGAMLVLPRWAFWFYWVPIAAFWLRYNVVRHRRDEALLRAEVAADGGRGAAGCYRSEAGICISDGTQHVLVLRNKPDASLKLLDVVRH